MTPQENEAIERLKMMGFPEALVVEVCNSSFFILNTQFVLMKIIKFEAFFACDKNEDLAVNYILQRMDEAAVCYSFILIVKNDINEDDLLGRIQRVISLSSLIHPYNEYSNNR